MPDREKITNGLEWILNDIEENGHYQVGYYADEIRKAVSLLKEQEAVEPRLDEKYARIYRCGACGEYVGFIDSDPGDPNEQDNYCRNCGRPVKWE